MASNIRMQMHFETEKRDKGDANLDIVNDFNS